MTQAPPEAGTSAPVDPNNPDDSIVGFSVTEVGLLIRNATDETRERGFSALQLSPDYFTDEIVGFGLSSLVARGWAKLVSEEDVELSGPAELLGYCLAEARRWTQFAFVAEEGGDIAVYIQAPDSSVLLQPRGAGTWFAMFRRSEARDSEVVRLALESAANLAPDSLAYFDSTTGDDDTRFLVRKAGGDQWKYAVPPSEGALPENPADADIPVVDVDTNGLLSKLDELLALPETGSGTSDSPAS